MRVLDKLKFVLEWSCLFYHLSLDKILVLRLQQTVVVLATDVALKCLRAPVSVLVFLYFVTFSALFSLIFHNFVSRILKSTLLYLEIV